MKQDDVGRILDGVKEMISVSHNYLRDELVSHINQRIDELKERIKHLPTKQEYYDREEKTVAEIQKMREEVVLAVGQREKIEEIEKRLDKVEKHLKLPQVRN